MSTFCTKDRPKDYELFFISPSWIELLPTRGKITLPFKFKTDIPEYRLQFLPKDSPPFIFRVYPHTNPSMVMQPWNIMFLCDCDIDFNTILTYLTESYCLDIEKSEFKSVPQVQGLFEEKLFHKRKELLTTLVILDLQISEKSFENAKRRSGLLKEIIETEQHYVDDILLAAKIFNESLFARVNLSYDLFSRTFKSLSLITPVHTEFLKSLTNAGDSIESSIGSIFIDFLPYFKTATPHVANFSAANSELTKLLKENKYVEHEFQQLCQQFFDGKTIENILVTPVQRIPRYPLFIQGLLKCTSSHHFDYEDLKEAYVEIQKLVKAIDKQKIEQDEVNKVLELQNELGATFQVYKQGRKMLASLKSVKVSNNHANFYLFNDMLLYQRLWFPSFVQFELIHTQIYHGMSLMVVDNGEMKISVPETEETREFAKAYSAAKQDYIGNMCSFGQALAWKKEESEPPHLRGALISSTNFGLFLFGGKNQENEFSNEIYKYNSNIWKKIECSDKPPARWNCSFLSFADILLLFGGQNENDVMNDVWIFTISTNKWNKIECEVSPSPRFGHASILLGTHMWVFGGRDKTRFFNELYSFDILSHKWTRRALNNPPAPRAWCTAFWISNGKYSNLAVFGGLGENDIVFNDIFYTDFIDKTWRYLETDGDKPTPRFGQVSGAFENSLFIIGGRNVTTSYMDDFKLDFTTQKWTRVPASNQPSQFAYCSCTIEEGFGLILYGNCNLYTIKLVLPANDSGINYSRAKALKTNPSHFAHPVFSKKSQAVTVGYKCHKSMDLDLNFNQDLYYEVVKFNGNEPQFRATHILNSDGTSYVNDEDKDERVVDEDHFIEKKGIEMPLIREDSFDYETLDIESTDMKPVSSLPEDILLSKSKERGATDPDLVRQIKEHLINNSDFPEEIDIVRVPKLKGYAPINDDEIFQARPLTTHVTQSPERRKSDLCLRTTHRGRIDSAVSIPQLPIKINHQRHLAVSNSNSKSLNPAEMQEFIFASDIEDSNDDLIEICVK